MPNPPVEILKSIRFGYIVSGSTLVLLTGFYQIIYHGFPYYLSQGWFHGKLTSGLALVGLGLYLFVKFAQVEQTGQALTRKFTAIMHSVVGIIFLASVSLVILGRS